MILSCTPTIIEYACNVPTTTYKDWVENTIKSKIKEVKVKGDKDIVTSQDYNLSYPWKTDMNNDRAPSQTESKLLARANDVLPCYEALELIPPGVSKCKLNQFIFV